MRIIGKAKDVKIELTKLNIPINSKNEIESFPEIDSDKMVVCLVNRPGLEGSADLWHCENIKEMREFNRQFNSGEVREVTWFFTTRRPECDSIVDITGLDKAAVLLALYNNAKNSAPATQNKALFYRRFNQAPTWTTELTLEEARKELSKAQSLSENISIDYIGPVAIKIRFDSNILNVSSYNRYHYLPGNLAVSASEVIAKLRGAELSNDNNTTSSLVNTSIWVKENKQASSDHAPKPPEKKYTYSGLTPGFLG